MNQTSISIVITNPTAAILSALGNALRFDADTPVATASSHQPDNLPSDTCSGACNTYPAQPESTSADEGLNGDNLNDLIEGDRVKYVRPDGTFFTGTIVEVGGSFDAGELYFRIAKDEGGTTKISKIGADMKGKFYLL